MSLAVRNAHENDFGPRPNSVRTNLQQLYGLSCHGCYYETDSAFPATTSTTIVQRSNSTIQPNTTPGIKHCPESSQVVSRLSKRGGRGGNRISHLNNLDAGGSTRNENESTRLRIVHRSETSPQVYPCYIQASSFTTCKRSPPVSSNAASTNRLTIGERLESS